MHSKKTLSLLIVAVFLASMLMFSDNLEFAYAVSVSTITLPSGNTAGDAVYYNVGTTNTRAWITANEGGIVKLYTKGSGTNNIVSSVELNVSSSGGQVVFVDDRNEVIVFTNLGIFRVDGTTNEIEQFLADGTYSGVLNAVWDDNKKLIYALEDAIIHTVDPNTPLFDRISWNDANMDGIDMGNSMFDFALDEDEGYIFIAKRTGATTNAVYRIDIDLPTWNVDDSFITSTANNPYGVALDTELQRVWVSIDNNARVSVFDYSLTLIGNTTIDTVPRKISVDSHYRRAYVGHSTIDQVTILDLDSRQNIFEQAVCDNPIGQLAVKGLISSVNVIVVCQTGTALSVLNDDTISPSLIPDGTACFDINPNPAIVQQICLEDNDGDGIPDAPNSQFFFRAGQNVTSISNDWFCQMGILADSDSDGVCDNYDVKTNGVGYFITIILFAFMIVMFAVAKLKTDLAIPEWLWIIGTFAILGAGIGFGWLDLTLFVIGIVIVVGMASFRIYSAIQGRFGGGE